MSCGFIYKIQFPNGKHYIGLTTTSLKQRQSEHNKCAPRWREPQWPNH
jgi:predicted GIY-YIG superfamily endonuclease